MRQYPQASKQSNLVLRAKVMAAVRQFFDRHQYLEIETPIRIPAPAPEIHIDAQAAGNWYLHTSPELCMKRLLAAGYDRIYQISKCFRKAERGHHHLPEMTLLEWYTAGDDYLGMMTQCEALIEAIAYALNFGHVIPYQDIAIDIAPPWPRLAVTEAFEQFAQTSVTSALQQDRFDEIIVTQIEPQLARHKPVFLYDYPVQRAALAKTKTANPDLAERFELYIGGIEICNAFSELNDPEEQRQRFEADRDARRAGGGDVYPLPEDFLTALVDMPPAAGNALGLDRLVMILADSACIDDVVAFTPEEL
jgi:lysyl-tRNA synthetase class 2